MQDSICFYVVMVPMAGLEPASREAVDFESTEFTISPHRLIKKKSE